MRADIAVTFRACARVLHERMADGAEGGSRRSAEAIEAQLLRGGGDIRHPFVQHEHKL